jgi:hypothetical protein
MIDVYYIHGPEYCGFVPKQALWRGRPTLATIRSIQHHTATDSEGRRYFYDHLDTRKKLRTAADFADLNNLIERF